VTLGQDAQATAYFPPPESGGGWRKLEDPEEIRRLAGADPAKLGALKDWLLRSDERNFAAVVIRRGHIVTGYSSHALAHASLVCETVTGQPYDQFAIAALFRPLGIEHWWFQFYEGGQEYGRHPSHGLGMPARDLARIAYCLLRGGRWRGQQVVPQWFVEQTAAPTHAVTTPELRWKFNPQIFTHGWELPARHWALGGRSGAGMPADARQKCGAGGQFIAFVPSLDLVVTRQTGASGEWQFEEYLRRACACVLSPASAARP
jgi:CubicO group peptidase (beta-lactamase class C family)